MKKGIFSIISVIIILFNTVSIYASQNYYPFEEQEKVIQELFVQKAQARYKKDYILESEIAEKLRALGVKELSQEEVLNKFYNSDIMPYIDYSSANAKWSTYRTTRTVNGISYEVQNLIAEPKNGNSNLSIRQSGTATGISAKQAGSAYILQLIASEALSAGASIIPGGSTALRLYDILKGAPGVNTSTSMSTNDINYVFSGEITACFAYVKKVGQSDNSQQLTYVSSMIVMGVTTTTLASWMQNGVYTTRPITNTQNNLTIKPQGYQSIAGAITAYYDVYAPKKSCVSRITFGSSSVSPLNYYPLVPEFPAYIN